MWASDIHLNLPKAAYSILENKTGAYSLKEIEELLKDHGFLRVHQSHLINPQFVKGILKHDGGSLIMNNDIEIPVSRQKTKQINEILETMLRFK